MDLIGLDFKHRDLKAAATRLALAGVTANRDNLHDRLFDSVGIQRPKIEYTKLCRRIEDQDWWIKTLRREARQRREKLWLALDPTALKWVSSDGMKERDEILVAAEKWADQTKFTATTDEGEEIIVNAPRQSEIDMHQRAEMLTIAHGITQMAGKDAKAYLCTVTAPSRFHPTRTIKKNDETKAQISNNKYDGSTPDCAQKWLQLHWARARAKFKRLNIGQYWLMAVQPHLDQTPHWHIVFFFPGGESEAEQVHEVLRQHFVFTERERGDEHRIDFEEMEGGSVGGIKYISRCIGYISRAVMHGDDTEAIQEAMATIQWASTWNIRRFRSSEVGKTAWRMARKKSVLSENHPLAATARANDFAKFTQIRKESEAKILYLNVKNKYGETSKKVIGLTANDVAFVNRLTWKKKSAAQVFAEKQIAEIEKRTVNIINRGRVARCINLTDTPFILHSINPNPNTNPNTPVALPPAPPPLAVGSGGGGKAPPPLPAMVNFGGRWHQG